MKYLALRASHVAEMLVLLVRTRIYANRPARADAHPAILIPFLLIDRALKVETDRGTG